MLGVREPQPSSETTELSKTSSGRRREKVTSANRQRWLGVCCAWPRSWHTFPNLRASADLDGLQVTIWTQGISTWHSMGKRWSNPKDQGSSWAACVSFVSLSLSINAFFWHTYFEVEPQISTPTMTTDIPSFREESVVHSTIQTFTF